MTDNPVHFLEKEGQTQQHCFQDVSSLLHNGKLDQETIEAALRKMSNIKRILYV